VPGVQNGDNIPFILMDSSRVALTKARNLGPSNEGKSHDGGIYEGKQEASTQDP